MIRPAVFSGSWYPADPAENRRYLPPRKRIPHALAVVCPHAGWIYSGKIAGEVYSRLPLADLYILVGPNHTGLGVSSSIYPEGRWQLPQGVLEVDAFVAQAIRQGSEFLQEDTQAHAREHCIEVQLPFIWLANPRAKIVPIVMRDYDPEVCQDIGRSIANALKKSAPPSPRKPLLIASSDFTHYESRRMAREKDQYAIEQILALDPVGLLKTCDRFGITMCGSGPTAAVLTAVRELGAQKAELIAYGTSGDITGDNDSVVGYAGIIIE